jgi:3-demethylubiquinone-9 3-methyltransferase
MTLRDRRAWRARSSVAGRPATTRRSAAPSRDGTVLTAEFELNGRRFTALNGGPQFKPRMVAMMKMREIDLAQIEEAAGALA